MYSLLKIAAVPFLTLFCLAGPTAGSAQAQGYGYALTTVENPTHLTIHYSVQWGDGGWVNYTLHPGQTRTHYVAYQSEVRTSPTLRIRFDEALFGNTIIDRQYVLLRYANHSVDRFASKRYVFTISPGGAYLDLVGVN